MAARIDLAKARHELRTPINHILGYCEILLEEEEMPVRILEDLGKIHTGGKQLLELISRYLDDATFGRQLDSRQVQHELRTPVNHIIGYSELLVDVAEELGQRSLLADLGKIRAAAQQWLSLMENHLFSLGVGDRPAAAAEPEPALEPVTSAATAARSAAPNVVPHQAAVLVVDDDQASRELLARRLHRAGFRVVTAGNGAEALELLGQRSFDLLLVDSVMPGMDGLELLRRVRETKSRTELPVIMVTGRDTSTEVAKALRLGANDYITKPVEFEPALARVATHLELRRAEASNRQRMADIERLAEDLQVRNDFIKQVFGRYVTDEVVQSILEHPKGLELGGSKRVVTILMCDLRGFTGLAERLPPETVVELLNHYLGAMAAVIEQHRGMVDEFIGDAILAIFGAPLARPDHAESAATCALAMQLEMERVNRRLSRLRIPPLEMGVGVNTGEVVVGNIGSDRRAKYGVVGAHVNLTGRIQSVTVGGEILISETTARALGGLLKADKTLTILPKGAAGPLTLHSLIGLRGQDHLELPAPSAELALPPSSVLPVKCFRIAEGKMLAKDSFDAELAIFSSRTGALRTEEPLQARTDLKLVFASPGARRGEEVYCKIMADGEGPFGRELRFTSARAKA